MTGKPSSSGWKPLTTHTSHGVQTPNSRKLVAIAVEPAGRSGDLSCIRRLIAWGEVELEPEVRDWFNALSRWHTGRVVDHINLLEERGVLLGEPHTRQLRGKLRELRFTLDGDAIRITYYIASGRRIILLTVFRKTARRERAEIERAAATMQRCIAEGHTAEDDE